MDLCVGEGLRGFGKVAKGHCLRGWEVGVGILAEVYFLVYYTKKQRKKEKSYIFKSKMTQSCILFFPD